MRLFFDRANLLHSRRSRSSAGGRFATFLLGAAIACCSLHFGATVRGDDVVTLRGAKDPRTRTRLVGQLLDYTGEGVQIRLASGREERWPVERVVAIESDWAPQHQKADSLAGQRKFAEALVAYRDAAAQEKRGWAVRRIIASSVLAFRELDQIDRAGDLFLNLVKKDPRTPHFDVIPLAWTSADPNSTLQQKAQGWLRDTATPASRLLGASWLIALGEQAAAVETLERLTTDADPRIALLAETQLWRTRLVVATTTDVERWQRQVDRLPERLRGGPCFTIGVALGRLEQHEQAALWLLRAPLAYATTDVGERSGGPHDVLSGEAFLAAGKQLEKMSQSGAAATLYRELIATRGESPQAAAAKERLGKLTEQ